jgi:hypothetical protein
MNFENIELPLLPFDEAIELTSLLLLLLLFTFLNDAELVMGCAGKKSG